MRRPIATVLTLATLASLTLLGGAGTTQPPADGAGAGAASGLYVRASSGSTFLAGRRVTVSAYLYNNFMPPIDPRTGLGNLTIIIEPNDPRGLTGNIQRVTAEITQGRARWRGTLTPFVNPAADTAIPTDLRGPTFGASGIRTFPAGTKVTINLTIRANGRDTKVTLRNVEVGAAY